MDKDYLFMLKKDGRFCSFKTYLSIRRVRCNMQMLDDDIMYFCKTWKAHRHNFMAFCKHNGYACDYEACERKLKDYEERIGQ